MSNASASADPPALPAVPIPEVCYITDVFDKALAIPHSSPVRKPLCDAIRDVLIEYLARASVAMFLEDNVKYTPTEVLTEAKGK